ncbi:MAG: hypothetical protein ACRDXE_06415, partial [Acidimicrobiales bacterium]
MRIQRDADSPPRSDRREARSQGIARHPFHGEGRDITARRGKAWRRQVAAGAVLATGLAVCAQGFAPSATGTGPGLSSSPDLHLASATVASSSYQLVAANGNVSSYGGAGFFGSTAGQALARPVVGMASTPDGHGYWLVASDGGIFTFGAAPFYGSTGNVHLAKPIVGMASTPDGHGYWLVASDGGIFAFGDAGFYGSTGAIRLNQPIVGMAATPSGHGYWLVASDGGIFSFGDAPFRGSGSGSGWFGQSVVAMAATQPTTAPPAAPPAPVPTGEYGTLAHPFSSSSPFNATLGAPSNGTSAATASSTNPWVA